MKIGIIVHSETGNTYSVALKLHEKLIAVGHLVEIERLRPIGAEQTDANKIRFEKLPDTGRYDALVIGGPVRGFSISPVLAAFIEQTKSLQNKKVACFATQFFPYPWMGGNRTIAQTKKICESKGAEVLGTGIVNWKSKQREKKITEVVEKLSILFNGTISR